MPLTDPRIATADNICDNYDFSYNVVDGGPWRWVVPGLSMVKTLYFEDPDDVSAPAIEGTFTVTFESETSPIPIEAAAIVRHELVGGLSGDLAGYVAAMRP